MKIETIARKITLSLAALLFCLFCLPTMAAAQNIANNSHWFDGSYYYTATIDDDQVFFTSYDPQGDGPYFMLKKVAGKPGEYNLTANNDPMPMDELRTSVGCKVQYVRNDGMNFLAIYNKSEDLVWTITLTPDSMADCYSGEEWAEEQPVADMLSSFLMNTRYLGRFPVSTIEEMMMEIRNKMGENLGIIASTNLALMEAELNVAEPFRLGNQMKEISVSNEKEFLEALGSNRIVRLDDNVHLNLTWALENAQVCNAAGIRMIDAYADLSGMEGMMSEDVSDGRQLVLKGFHNLTLLGGRNCSIQVDPRYSYIFRFVECEDLVIQNLTLGHTEGGYCEGGVIGLEDCHGVTISRSDLYGCGTYGIEATDCSNLYMESSIIRDCTYGILQLRACFDFMFSQCDFYRNERFDLIMANDYCESIHFFDCRFSQNKGLLFDLSVEIRMEDCEIHHDLATVGSTIKISDSNTTWDGKANYSLPSRQIGPDTADED